MITSCTKALNFAAKTTLYVLFDTPSDASLQYLVLPPTQFLSALFQAQL
ncbi:MAG: hypothetical protein K940chlam1_01287 [Candidatus Anoxychlamydiales bacterium]|nr:hypothetical protein [Candidatus Anoxychlamydiales bacterium]NGX36139.1 hypothetical protein [Candidatus Anoxychlamydiales bacterium]